MREDVLKVIKSAKDVTNAVVLTHNIDFLFVQSVVLPALSKCGAPALTIFADADCAAQTYEYQARMLNDLGLRYRVVPVAMKAGFRFHPKAVLLSGPSAATLLVGSGNLTFGGWRENGEVWCRYDSEADGGGVFGAFRAYLREIVELCADPSDAIAGEVEEAFDPNTRTWAESMDPPERLLGRAGRGVSMLERMRAVVGAEPADHLYICAFYFDEDAEALRSISEELDVAKTTVFVQSKRTNLLEAAAASLGPQIELKSATFAHKGKVGAGNEESIRYALLHAKFYGVVRDDEVTVFAGSANCSRAALTIPGSAGNAELMTHATYSRSEFEREFIEEITVDDETLELAVAAAEPPPTDAFDRVVKIRAARMELGAIRVEYEAPPDVQVSAALLDDMLVEPSDGGPGWATFRPGGQPRIIVLLATHGREEKRSGPHWIDHEGAPRASARGRSLAESIHTQVRASIWGIGAWTNVLSELYKHLQYMPERLSRPHAGQRGAADGGKEPPGFEWGDVFADDYGLPAGGGFGSNQFGDSDARIGSLRAMLLRWYGVDQPELRQRERSDDGGTPQTGSTAPDDEDGEGVDEVAPLPKVVSRPKLQPPSEKERKRALKLVSQVTSRLAEADFLSERNPRLLAADLKVAAVLLRAGLADGWLSRQEFLDATLAIWLPLFFSAAEKETTGWLEQRYLTAPDQDKFAEEMRSVELAAALGCWALSTPDKVMGPAHARFELASALGVARLPWLWQTAGNAQVARGIAELLEHTSGGAELDWKSVERRWRTLIRRGYALSRLQDAIGSISPKDLRARIQQPEVDAGELLWQGKFGFCVAKRACARVGGEKGEILILQQGGATKIFMGPFLMPVAGLLEANVLSENAMPARARMELLAMVEELRVGLAA